MLSDISIKCSALGQVALHRCLHSVAQSYSPLMVKTAAVIVCLAEVLFDTMKHPGVVVENGIMAGVNLVGSQCSKKYTLTDAEKNVKKIGIGLLTSAVALAIVPYKLALQFSRVVSDPASSHPYDPTIIQDTKIKWVTTAHLRVGQIDWLRRDLFPPS